MKFRNLSLLFVFLLALFLRFYRLNQFPPSLYWEETALGYDAYSLLKTGKDHRGNSWPVVYLESFMDFKPPLYIYTLIPSIAIFGLNEFSVRFPSAFFGTLTVLIIYFLTQELFKDKKLSFGAGSRLRGEMGLIASFLLAVSPWHLQFSRAAFEGNLALFLVVLGAWLFLKSFKKHFLLIISSLCFILSLYAYHGARVFSFFLVLTLGVIYFKKVLKIPKIFLVIVLITGLGLSWPLIKSLNSAQVRQRFQETSVFATLEPILASNKKIEEDGGGRIAKLIHHRLWEYSRMFLGQYFKHFSGAYLFLSGDTNYRHSTQEFGQLYHWEIISLILGAVFLLKNLRKKPSQLILFWCLLGPIPGAITKAAPHSLRTIFGLPAFIIISALGLIQLIELLKNRRILLFTVYCLLFTDFVLYLHFYYHHYPKLYSFDWQYGYKEAVGFVKENQDKYESIYLTNNYGRAYMYYLFYTQMDPRQAQSMVQPYQATPDIPRLGKVFFTREPGESKELMVGSGGEIDVGRLIKTIQFLDGRVAFEIREK